MCGQLAAAAGSTEYGHDDWQRALVRLGASDTLEMIGTAVVIEHDIVDETLRLHAHERTDVERVREVVRAAAVALGISDHAPRRPASAKGAGRSSCARLAEGFLALPDDDW